MDVNNIRQATHWLMKGQEIKLENDLFIKEACLASWRRSFNKGYHIWQVERVIARVTQWLQHLDPLHKSLDLEKKDCCLALGDAIIKKYQRRRLRDPKLQETLKLFDRVLAGFRHETAFAYKDNRAFYEKWRKYHLPPKIFFKHGKFCDFLLSSQLLSQIKVTRDTIEEIGGQPCLLVDGHWTKWPEIQKRFQCVYARSFQENVIEDKETADTYSYLDNRSGLQNYHPYRDAIYPISRLNDDEVRLTLTKAREFIRPKESRLPEDERRERNKERTFVIQVVSSSVKSWDTNFSRLFLQPQHPYFRIIIGEDILEKELKIEKWDKVRKGDVFCIGFGHHNKNGTLQPQIGQFRGPDIWEYKDCEERIVTNIAITREEALNIIGFIRKYHKRANNLGNETAPSPIHQNRSVFVRTALQTGNIQIPTNINLPDTIAMLAPDKIRTLGKALNNSYTAFKRKCRTITRWILPTRLHTPCETCASRIYRWCIAFFKGLFALIVVPLCLLLEEVIGEKGETFSPYWKRLVDLSRHNYNLPGILQQWQRQQPSTVITKNPVRLAIVPDVVV